MFKTHQSCCCTRPMDVWFLSGRLDILLQTYFINLFSWPQTENPPFCLLWFLLSRIRLQSSLELSRKTSFPWPSYHTKPIGRRYGINLWTLTWGQPAVMWSSWILSEMHNCDKHHPGDEWGCQSDERPSRMKDLSVCTKQLVLWKVI